MSEKYSQRHNYSNSTRAAPNSVSRHTSDDLMSSNYSPSNYSNVAPASSSYNSRNNSFAAASQSRPSHPVVLNLYQSNLPSRNQASRNYSNKQGSKQGSGFGASTSENIDSKKEDTPRKEDLKASAISVSNVSTDKNLQIMIKGIQLQQEAWCERQEFKRFFSKATKLMQLLTSLTLAEAAAQPSILESLFILINKELPFCLDQLQHVNKMYINTLISCQSDIKTVFQDINQEKLSEEEINKEFFEAEKMFARAKKRRLYQLELESLAGEMLLKKSRTVCEFELKQEAIKLQESQEELLKWKKLHEIRQLQKESILHFVKEIMKSITNSTEMIKLIEPVEEKVLAET